MRRAFVGSTATSIRRESCLSQHANATWIDRTNLPAVGRANLVESLLPALTGVVDNLNAGARVADVGCGHGASTILMAQAFPD